MKRQISIILVLLLALGTWYVDWPNPISRFPMFKLHHVALAASTNQIWSSPEQANITANSFIPMQGGWEAPTTEANAIQILPTGGAIVGYTVTNIGVAPTGTDSWDIVPRKNGVNASATCNINVGAASCTFAGNIDWSACAGVGCSVVYGVTKNGTPGAAKFKITTVFSPTIADETVVMGNSRGTSFPTTDYSSPIGAAAPTVNEYGNYIVNPLQGTSTVKKFFGKLSVATGVGNTKNFFVSQNGNTSSSAVQVNFVNASSTNITAGSGTFTTSPGDYWSIYCTVSGAAASTGAWGFVVVPGVSGYFGFYATSGGAIPGSTNYPLDANDGTVGLVWPVNSTSIPVTYLNTDVLFNAMYAKLQNAPGAGASGKFINFDLSVNGNNSPHTATFDLSSSVSDNLECQIFEVATTCSSLATTSTNALGSFVARASNSTVYTRVSTTAGTTFGTAAVSYSATMNFTLAGGCEPNAMFIDFNGGLSPSGTAVTEKTFNASVFGRTGSFYQTGTVGADPHTMTYSSAAHKTPNFAIPTFCSNPWPGDLGTTGFQIVTASTATWYFAPPPPFATDSAYTTGPAFTAVWDQMIHAPDALLNADTPVGFHGASEALNVPTLWNSGTSSPAFGFETSAGPMSCVGHIGNTNQVVVNADQWYKIMVQYNPLIPNGMIREVRNYDFSTIVGAAGNAGPGKETFTSCYPAGDPVNYIRLGQSSNTGSGTATFNVTNLLFYWGGGGSTPPYPPANLSSSGGGGLTTLGAGKHE